MTDRPTLFRADYWWHGKLLTCAFRSYDGREAFLASICERVTEVRRYTSERG